MPDDSSDETPIDGELIRELRDEGEGLLEDLVEMFIGAVPAQLDALDAALVRGDAGATRLSAHTLRGTASNFGARRMQTLASTIEDKGRDGALDGAAELLLELRTECGRVRQALERAR